MLPLLKTSSEEKQTKPFFLLHSVFLVFLFESLFICKDGACYRQEDGESSLLYRFMTVAGRRHEVPKLSKRVFPVFVFISFSPWLRRIKVTMRREIPCSVGIAPSNPIDWSKRLNRLLRAIYLVRPPSHLPRGRVSASPRPP